MSPIAIRPMTEGDLEAKARLHVACWNETYTGLLPATWLQENITYEGILARQQRIGWERVLLACDGNKPVGFASWEPETRPWADRPGASEVSSLYLLRSHQGRGVGRTLMEAALARCPHPEVVLLALETNARAIGFYEHLGFSLTGRRIVEGPIHEAEMLLTR